MSKHEKSEKSKGPSGSAREGRVLVEHKGNQRPFMRGIMVHSLMARGVGFDDAFRAANEVKERIQGRGVVPRKELLKLVEEIIGEGVLSDHQPPIPIPGTIAVGEGDDTAPFSKGILSQSLLASSIDPSDAWDVAREIEFDLHRNGRREVARRELRRLAHEALLRRFGSRTASRYLIWRRFQEPERPVIILLGGTSGCGKTSLALEVARRLGISRVLSTDSIRQVMRIMLSPELMPAIHASSFDAHRAIANPIEGDIDSPENIVHGFMAQATTVSVGVRAMLDRAVAESTSMVLDGVSLVPGLIDLEALAGRAHVIYLVVARLDEPAFRKNFKTRGKRQSHRHASRYVDHLDEILCIQEHFLELADLHDIPIVDNVSIDGSVMLVIRHVVETLRENEGLADESLQ